MRPFFILIYVGLTKVEKDGNQRETKRKPKHSNSNGYSYAKGNQRDTIFKDKDIDNNTFIKTTTGKGIKRLKEFLDK